MYNWSMRTSIVLTIILMGILGIVLSIITGELYRDLAIENQRNALEQLITLKVNEQIQDAEENLVKLGLAIQHDENFRQAFASRNRHKIEAALEEHYHRYFITTAILKVHQFIVYDKDFNLLAKNVAGSNNDQSSKSRNPCPTIIQDAVKRSSTNKIKPLFGTCQAEGQAYMSIIVAIGGLKINGYLQVLADPVHNLSSIEKELGMPLKLSDLNGNIVYESTDLSNKVEFNDMVVVPHVITNAHKQPILVISLGYNISNLIDELKVTRNKIIIAATLSIIVALVLTLLLMQKLTFLPLKRLAKQLQLVRSDRSYLGEVFNVTGCREVRALANNFNEMSAELDTLYGAMEKMAYTDSLTDLPNRPLFYDRLNQLVEINKRNQIPFVIFMMDLDRFKYINDTLGHHIGDKLLQQISARLLQTVRGSDTIARLGGDEFAMLLPTITNKEGAIIAAKRVIDVLSGVFDVNGHMLKVGISIGMVICPDHGNNSNELIQRADLAMYYAKQNSQGFSLYASQLDSNSMMELTLESELKTAIENNDLQLYYQPKIEMNSGRVSGVEALVRWDHPKHGFIAPDIFIPIADKTGLIKPLTLWVLKTALKQIKIWNRKGLRLSVAVNISAHSLGDADLPDVIRKVLNDTGVDEKQLTLELTESAIMSDTELALKILNKLDKMGVTLAVDDFGTGYSSLSYLKRLPVDEIKIDRTFIIDMVTDTHDEVIVRSTIDLAHNMGMKVIAEGIENEHTWSSLKKMNCDAGQGFHICRPVAAATFEDWLFNSEWTVIENPIIKGDVDSI